MYRQQRNSGINRLDSYDEALNYFLTTTIIRGRGDNSRKPLGQRSKVDHYSMDLTPSTTGTGNDVVCYLGSHPQVTYHTDNTLTIHYPKYGMITAAAFVGKLTGVSAAQQDNRFVISAHGAVGTPEQHSYGNYAVPREGLRLKYVAHTTGGYNRTLLHMPDTDKPTNAVHVLKGRGQELKSVMGQYSAALDYVYGMFKLREGEINHREYEVFGTTILTYTTTTGAVQEYVRTNTPACEFSDYEQVEQLFEYLMSDEPEDNYKALLTLHYNLRWSNKWDIHSLEALVKKYVIARHKDTVLEEVSVPVGTIRKDSYGWCFKK